MISVMSTSAANPAFEQTDLFEAGTDGYANYRIPAIVVASTETLIAFCEGRKNGSADAGQIDLVMRRSVDNGQTWSPLQVVWSDGDNTCGNPSPVIDRNTGRVWLFMTWNLGTDKEKMIDDGTSSDTRRVFVTHSDDRGITWTVPDEVTSAVKQPDWRWYATGPGHAIQLASGRLVVPANHSVTSGNHTISRSHVILSDDHGKTWHRSAVIGDRTNESTVAELSDGRLYINMRSYRGMNARATALSSTAGESWSEVHNDPALVEPVCEASVLRHQLSNGGTVFLFSNPAATKRVKMTVKASRDDCRTWNAGQLIHEGSSGYSDLCSLDPDTVGLLYERNAGKEPYGRITFARLPAKLLLEDSATTSTQP